MIQGQFGTYGELIFPVELVASTGEVFEVDAFLDTAFTGAVVYVPAIDVEVLGWQFTGRTKEMITAQGDAVFPVYRGQIILDGKELKTEVVVGNKLSEVLLGAPIFDFANVEIKKSEGILTLEVID